MTRSLPLLVIQIDGRGRVRSGLSGPKDVGKRKTSLSSCDGHSISPGQNEGVCNSARNRLVAF